MADKSFERVAREISGWSLEQLEALEEEVQILIEARKQDEAAG